MDPETALRQEAGWQADALDMLGRPPDGSGSYRARAMGYRPRARPHGPFTCPKCWVSHTRRMDMRPIPGTDEYDVLKCNGCSAEIIIPF